jgi:excinuclease UvrABC nuclease subunit
VDSAFEADLVYLEIAREVFPASYRGMVGFDPAWFVQVNPENNFPRYVKTIDPRRAGVVIGPFGDKHAAARFIQLVEDAFDLCRYYNILVEAPRGRACAYKEMGKCPAPCDGSISMEQYRELIAWSARTVVSPGEFIEEHTQRMNAAAAELNFESAGKIKQFVEQISQFGKGAFRFARRMEDFRFVSLQHGPRAGTAKVLVVCGGRVSEVAGLISEPRASADLLRAVLEEAGRGEGELDERGVERMGVVTDHLFRAKRRSGVYVRLEEVEEKSFLKAYRELLKQDAVEESEEEGVVKELQQM